jgi:hypothetical protein
MQNNVQGETGRTKSKNGRTYIKDHMKVCIRR